MKYLIIFFIFFPLSLWADTTGNLLNQNFTNSSWTGTNQSSRHGTGTIAGVDGKYVESTISLSDTLTESQINNGWTSTLGADIWHWNNLNSTTTMKQTITDANGTVTTQIREVANTGCGYINCGDWATYTDSYTQGINQQSDYDIAVRFTFDESSSSSSHYGTDLKNPTLTIIHSLITTEQAETLSEISETVNEIIETEVETVEFEPMEEFTFEIFNEPVTEVALEEIYFETVAVEEINTGVIDVFNIETFENLDVGSEEFTDIIETIDIPMEEMTYDNNETIETFSTEIEIGEELFETGPEEGAANYETSDTSGIIEPEPLREETSTGGDGEITTEEVNRGENGTPPGESEERIADEPGGTSEVAENSNDENSNETVSPETISDSDSSEDTVVAEEEITDESVGEGETSDSGGGDEGTEVADSGEETLESGTETVAESRDEGGTRVSTQTVSIESIEKKVNETIKKVDQRLIATSLIVAKAMQNNKILDSYNNINQDIFNNQPLIDGGDYYERREYIDGRNIYHQNQNVYSDMVVRYQEQIQKTADEVIRAEEHLRRIRGY